MWGKTASTESELQAGWEMEDLGGWAFLSTAFRTSITAERIQCARTFDMSVRTASGLSVFKTSNPLQAAMTKRLFWQLMAFVGLIASAFAFIGFRNYSRASQSEATHVRFVVHELRGGGDPSMGQVQAVGLLLDGCMLDVGQAWERTDADSGAELALTLAAPVKFDGFYLVTSSDAPPELDPVAFSLEAQTSSSSNNSTGASWERVAASRRQVRSTDDLVWLAERSKKPLPTARKQLLEIDARRRLLEVGSAWTFAWVALGSLLVAILSSQSSTRFATPAVVAIPLLSAVARFVPAISAAVRDRELSLSWFQGIALLAIAAGISLRPQYLLELGGLLAPWGILTSFLEPVLLYGTVQDVVFNWGTIALGMVFGSLVIARHVQVWRAKRLVHEDIQRYEGLWKTLLRDEEERLGLEAIEAVISHITLRCAPGTLCQLAYTFPAQSLDATHRPQDRVYDALSDAFYNPNALTEIGILGPGDISVACRRPNNPSHIGSEGGAWSPLSSAGRFLQATQSWLARAENSTSSRQSGSLGARSALRLLPAGECAPSHSEEHVGSRRSLLSPARSRQGGGGSVRDRMSPQGGQSSGLSPLSRGRPRRAEMTPWKRLFPHTQRQSSLDLLYAQAAAVQVMLNLKVAEWGAASDGLCAVREGGFAPWGVAVRMGAAEQERELKRGEVKRAKRAAEKLNRAYGGDASRLLDVSRDCLVYESANQLAIGIRVIHADDDVEIVGVKNRLGHDHDARRTCGYRDVSLIIRFCTEAAERRKLDLHLCELQLLLKDFAVLKNEEGHARYVRLRDARGE